MKTLKITLVCLLALLVAPSFAHAATNGNPMTPLAGATCNGSSCNGAPNGPLNPFYMAPSTNASFGVTGTFWQTTQPVSGTFWQTTQPVSGTVTITPSGTQTVAGSGTAGSPAGGVVTVQGATSGTPLNANLASATPATATASGSITVQDTASTTTVGAYSVNYYTGAPTAGSTVSQALSGIALARVQVAGTFTGTVQIESSQDGGTTWRVSGGHVNGAVYSGATLTAPGSIVIGVGGATNIRVRATAAMTGTVNVTMTFSNAQTAVEVVNPVAIKDNVSGNQAAINSSGQVATNDPNNAAFGGAISVTPGTPFTAGRSIGFVCTSAGNITVTLSDASTMTFPIVVSPSLQTLPLAATNITLTGATAGTFWSLK